MKLVSGSKRNSKLLFKIFLLIAIIYVIALFVNQKINIASKQRKIEELKQQISVQEVKICEIESELDSIGSLNSSESLENIAHNDLNLLHHGERVFVNIKGN